MNSGKWFEREDRRNTTVERVDRSGRFKVIDHYDEKGVRKTIIRRLDTRFTKGQSGNPKGRPKGSLNATTLLKEIFNTTVPVREGDRRQFMSRAEAMLRATFANGLRGDARSLTTIMDLLEMTGYLDVELNRQWAPSIQEEHPRDMEEWYLLGPHRESERRDIWYWLKKRKLVSEGKINLLSPKSAKPRNAKGRFQGDDVAEATSSP